MITKDDLFLGFVVLIYSAGMFVGYNSPTIWVFPVYVIIAILTYYTGEWLFYRR